MDTILIGLGLILVVALGEFAHDLIVAALLTVRGRSVMKRREAQLAEWEAENSDLPSRTDV